MRESYIGKGRHRVVLNLDMTGVDHSGLSCLESEDLSVAL